MKDQDQEHPDEAVDEAVLAWHEEQAMKAGCSAVVDDILTERDKHYKDMTTNWLTLMHDSGDPVWQVPGYTGTSREATFVNRLVTIESRHDAKQIPKPRELMPVWGPRVLREAQKRAALKRLPITLTESDMLWLVWRSKGACELSGLPFDMAKRASGQWRPFTPSIDQISAKGGYSMKNVRLVTLIANVAMNGWGEEPLIQLAEALLQRRETGPERIRNSNRNAIRNTDPAVAAKPLKVLVPRDGIEPPTLRFSVQHCALILLGCVTKPRGLPGIQMVHAVLIAANTKKPAAARAGRAW